jgi:hypothetical protein
MDIYDLGNFTKVKENSLNIYKVYRDNSEFEIDFSDWESPKF